jgi:hypothetical protein
MWRFIIILPFFMGGCVGNQQVQDTTKSAAASQFAEGDAIAPSPQADQQGWVSFLDQRTTAGIDPLGLMLLIFVIVFLSHRREVMRLKNGKCHGDKEYKT